MTNRHFYRHKGTGLVAAMNDSFAAVFSDRLERVDAEEAKTSKSVDEPTVVPADNAAANPDNLTASKEDK